MSYLDIMKPCSGHFLLRVDPVLHARLKQAARAAELSFNEYCERLLRLSPPRWPGYALQVAVARAQEIHGQKLVGVVLYGSLARGEAVPGSDIDLLIVLDHDTAIARASYREWDSISLEVDGFCVEPSIVALPKPEQRVSGLWAEIAIDGLILWSRSPAVHRYLIGIREKIGEGKLRRQRSHGQSYWVNEGEAAETCATLT